MTRGAQRLDTCWLNSSIAEQRLCAESLLPKMKGRTKRVLYLEALRQFGAALPKGDLAAQTVLAGMTPQARVLLMKYSEPSLRVLLAKRIARLPDAEVRLPTRQVRIPEGLPDSLRNGLLAYQQRLQNRYETLIRRGHSRARRYLTDAMRVPIRFGVFLASKGIERWDMARKRELVAFFEQNPAANRQHLERFLRSVRRNMPFHDRRRAPTKRCESMRERRQPLPPEVLRPEAVNEFLATVRNKYGEPEYLLAWMVGRLGMMAKHAYNITLDRIQINEDGRMVVLPALVWVEVPARTAARLQNLIHSVEPSWGQADPETLRHITLFDHFIPDLDVFGSKVLEGRTRVLRNSAIYAAMLNGNVDRVTLHHTMGVSMPTIQKLESLLTTDMHRRLDIGLVERRNAHITGNRDA